MRKIQALVCVMACVLLCSVVWAAAPSVTNFTADVVTTTRGNTHTSKMFSKNCIRRIESGVEGKEMITIVRTDKDVVWMLRPATKTYLEMPSRRQKNDLYTQLHDPNVKSEKTFMGDETVEGHPAKKYHVTIIKDGKEEASGFVWEATDMNNFLIEHQTEDQQITTVWRNIKLVDVPDSLFEVPAGYKRMNMPGLTGTGLVPRGKTK